MEMLLRPVQFILEEMAKQLWRSIRRQIGYLVHYKENIEKLDDEVREIGDTRGGLQRQVDAATNRGEIVEVNVCQWLTDVDQKKQEVDQFLGNQRQEHKGCFHFCSRYSGSKEAKKKIDAFIKLKNKGKFDSQGISHPAPPPEFGFQSSADYRTFESRAKIFNQIMEALKNNGVNVIGIYGIGGVGKTTMVEEVGKQVKKDGVFDEVVMAVVSQSAKIEKIQEQLADRLDLSLKKKTKDGRAGELWNRLNNGKRNLVILDDVWEELKLNEVGIPISDGVQGCCKVVLTSRIQGVCQRIGVREPFLLGVLLPQESWDLFKEMVRNSVRTPNIPSIAEEVCKECGNLPVAILAVAAALKDKEDSVWADALKQLRDSEVKNIEGVDSRVYSSLELSYTYLQWEDAKWCFLLCCLFPEDSEISIDDFVRYGMGMRVFGQNIDTLEEARNRVHTLVGTLKTSCLLLEGTRDQNSVKMHDVIRDVAISIAKEKEAYLVKQGVRLEEWPEEDVYKCCKVISLRYEKIVQYPHVLECPELRSLIVGVNEYSMINIPDDFFNGIRELKVLDLSCGLRRSLPSSLSNLSTLQMLCLRDCQCEDISILGDLKNLEMLEVGGSLIKKLPLKIRHLTRLRLLDLRSCISLEVIPPNVISRLSRLEELYLPKQFGRWEVEATKLERRKASVDELEKLSHLTSLEIFIPKEVTFLPKEIPFQKLTRFNISVRKGSFVTNYPIYYTKILYLGGMTLKDEFKVLLEKTEVLRLVGMNGLEKLLHSRDKVMFTGLKFFEVASCDGIKHLLSSQIGRDLVQLQYLEISKCENMEEIIGNDQREGRDAAVVFKELKTMKLESLPKLRSFYPGLLKPSSSSSTPTQALFNEKVACPSLEDLYIKLLPNIREIWDNQSQSFSQLMVLIVSNCDNLRNVFSFSIDRNLVPLQKIMVSSCRGQGEESNDEIVNFPALTALVLEYLPEIKSFCNFESKKEDEEEVDDNDTLGTQLFNQKVAFPSLECLSILQLPNIREIWDNPSESFSQLRELYVSNCNNLRNLFSFSMARNLVPLQERMISSCRGQREESNDEIVNFPALTTLELKYLPELKSFCNFESKKEDEEEVDDNDTLGTQLFNQKIAFPSLEDLTIERLPSIREIWNNQSESFNQLRKLYVSDCDNLRNAVSFSVACNLVYLQEIRISSCPKMEVILAPVAARRKVGQGEESNDEIVNFPALTSLKLEDLPKLKSFCNSKSITFSELETLELEGLPNLKSFCNSRSIIFSQLTTLILWQLPNLKSFCNSKSEKEDEEEGEVKDKDTLQAQLFFNQKVTFPALKRLEVDGLDCIREIWASKLAFPAQEEESFSQLKYLDVKYCNELVNVVPANMLPRLHYLEEFQVGRCKSVLSLVEGAATTGKDEQANDDEIIFPRLRSLQLCELGKLNRFYDSKTGELDLDNCSLQPFFNHKVAFPYLENLTIRYLPSIREIWDNQSESFSQLRRLYVSNCDNLRNVVSFSIARNLVHLQEIKISSCRGQGEESNDEIVNFPALSSLTLWSLPKLKSFCNFEYKKEDEEEVEDNETLGTQLFNQKVTFPALERLEVSGLDCIKEIWADRLAFPALKEESFSQLKCLCVKECPKLMNVVPANMLPRLQYLQELKVDRCKSVLSLVEGAATTGKGEQANDDKIIFPQLRALKLESLSKLKGFYNSEAGELDQDIVSLQSFFNNKVAFPSLDYLSIMGLPNIREIWDNQSESFSQLRKLYVSNCDNLRNVFSFSMTRKLGHLQEITIGRCPKMKVIVATVAARRKEGQGEEFNDEIINFPALRTLSFWNLPKLKSFCNFESKKEDVEEVEDNETLGTQLFNQKCDSVTTLFSVNSLPRLQNIGKLIMKSCDQMRVVFDLGAVEGLNVGKRQVEIQLALRVLHLRKLPALNCIWHKDPNRIMGFQILEKVTISKCGLLKNLFSSSVARTLEKLQGLAIDSCIKMEAIVEKEETEEVTDEIVFPQLKVIMLDNLPNLTSFCDANYAFNIPSLRQAKLISCPKMQTFTFGQLNMPNIKIYANKDQWVWGHDLNKYIKQQVLKEKESTLVDGKDDDISNASSDDGDNDFDGDEMTFDWSDSDIGSTDQDGDGNSIIDDNSDNEYSGDVGSSENSDNIVDNNGHNDDGGDLQLQN